MRMQDVRYLTASKRQSLIRTVEEAIDYIDTQLAEAIAEQPGFLIAKEALHQALDRRITIKEARKFLVAALQDAKLFIP